MARLGFKASRPIYRRGGLVLSSAEWITVEPGELADEALRALFADPVVVIRVELDEGGWRPLSALERSGVLDLVDSAEGRADAGFRTWLKDEDQRAAEGEAQAKAYAEAQARSETEAQAKADAEAHARAEAEAQAKADAEAQVRSEAEAQARADAEAHARAEAEAQAKAEAEAQAKPKVGAKAKKATPAN